MTAGYLQRLLDRSPSTRRSGPAPISRGVPTEPAPSAPSASPIAQADQRLNDPDLAEHLGYGLFDAFNGEPEVPAGPTSEARSPQLAPAWAPPAVDPFPRRPPPVGLGPSQPSAPAGQAAEVVPAAPPSTTKAVPAGPDVLPPLPPAAPPTHHPPRPQISPVATVADLPQRPAPPGVPAVDPEPVPPVPVEAHAGPLRDEWAPRVQPAPPPVAEPPPPAAPAPPVAEPAPAPPGPGQVLSLIDVRNDDDAPVAMPSPPPPEPAVARIEPAATVAPPPAPAVLATPTVSTTPPGTEPPRQLRPMTATSASVIGPLAPRPRSVTLFGTRRR